MLGGGVQRVSELAAHPQKKKARLRFLVRPLLGYFSCATISSIETFQNHKPLLANTGFQILNTTTNNNDYDYDASDSEASMANLGQSPHRRKANGDRAFGSFWETPWELAAVQGSRNT